MFQLLAIESLYIEMLEQIAMCSLSSQASFVATFRSRDQTAQAEVAPVQVLLATAWFDLHTPEGRHFKVRVLLDQGSILSFISTSLCRTLRTKRQRVDLQIHCFGDNFTGFARSKVSLRLGPYAKPRPTFPFTAYVFQRITTYAVLQVRFPPSWPHLCDLELADPDSASRQPIHLLIGADLYGSLLMSDLRHGPLGTPTAQRTAFGWIISGPMGLAPCRANVAQVSHCIQHPPPIKDEEQLVPSRLESFVCFPSMRSEHPVKVKKLRDTKTTARTALANRGSPGEPSRGLSDTTRTSNADCIKTRIESRPSVDSVSVTTCINCAGSYNLATCEDFLSKSIAQRNALVKNKQVCFKCLRPGHFTLTCLSRSRCIHCNRNHHSLMHHAAVTAETPVDLKLKVDDLSRMVSHASSARVTNVKNVQTEVAPVGVLLATASVDPYPSEGQCFQVRALLD